MPSFRKSAVHDTTVARKNAAFAEDLADFGEGDRVMTVDGFPGKVTSVLFGPYQGSETYQVELDGGMGGGDYNSGQLAPIRQTTASKVEAAEVTSSVLVEATTDHMANVDYPELENILEERPPIENLRIFAKTAAGINSDKMGESEAEEDDSTENLNEDPTAAEDPKVDDVSDPDADPEDPEDLGEDPADSAKLGDVTPPSACSYCGSSSFGDPQTTGRGVRMRCDQCGGTMTSWGGQWQPEFPNSSQNHAAEGGDYRSGGVGGVVQAPGANFKTTMLNVTGQMSRRELIDSLQSEAGIVSWMFTRLYEKARAKEKAAENEWWQPAPNMLGTNTVGAPQYNLITPKQVSLGSLSEYEDSEWKWHFTSSWIDVQAKARKIRRDKHVKIVSASKMFVAAEVQGDQAVYETQLNYVPNTRKVADWSCGCKWASYAWGRSAHYRRFEGRLCSHALATQYEASARGIFGRDVEPDVKRPDWQKSYSPVVVQYDKSQGRDLTRRAVPPGNMKRTFSSLMLDTDGIFPEPGRLDLAHPPIYASVQTMADHGDNVVDMIEMIASYDVDLEDARRMVFDALLSAEDPQGDLGRVEAAERGSAFDSEAAMAAPCETPGAMYDSDTHGDHVGMDVRLPFELPLKTEQDAKDLEARMHNGMEAILAPYFVGHEGKTKKKHRQDHGVTWGYGYGLGWGPCGLCGGSGCNNCNGTGQVPPDDDDAVSAGGAVDAGGAVGDGGATSKVIRRTHIFMPGEDEPICGAHNSAAPKEAEHVFGGFYSADHDKRDTCRVCQDSMPENVALSAHPMYHNAFLIQSDYSSNDPLVGLDGGHGLRPSVEHSNSDNPASTGWATSQDPGDWGRSLISNDFGTTFDASLHTGVAPIDPPNPWEEQNEYEQAHPAKPFSERHPFLDSLIHDVGPVILGEEIAHHAHPHESSIAAEEFEARLGDEAMFHDEPQGALPYTEGDEDIDADPGPGNTGSEGRGGETIQDTASIIAEFQRTAGGQALAKEAMKDFSFDEQQELINEGHGTRARNFDDLKIAGTHYEQLGDDDMDETVLWL